MRHDYGLMVATAELLAGCLTDEKQAGCPMGNLFDGCPVGNSLMVAPPSRPIHAPFYL